MEPLLKQQLLGPVKMMGIVAKYNVQREKVYFDIVITT